jgi:hypothetical protein
MLVFFRWAKEECKRQNMLLTSKYLRTVLEDVIHFIRFPQMNPLDITFKVAPAQVLTTDEVVSILLYFPVPEQQRYAIYTYIICSLDSSELEIRILVRVRNISVSMIFIFIRIELQFLLASSIQRLAVIMPREERSTFYEDWMLALIHTTAIQ